MSDQSDHPQSSTFSGLNSVPDISRPQVTDDKVTRSQKSFKFGNEITDDKGISWQDFKSGSSRQTKYHRTYNVGSVPMEFHFEGDLDSQPRIEVKETEARVNWITPEQALRHIQKSRPQIDKVFSKHNITKTSYALLAGFDQAIIHRGSHHLEQVHIFTSADVVKNIALQSQLGRILSPFSAIIFSESSPCRLPAFKPDGSLWPFDDLARETASSSRAADCRHAQVTSLSQTSGGADSGSGGSGKSSGPQKNEQDAQEPDRDQDGDNEGQEDDNEDDNDGEKDSKEKKDSKVKGKETEPEDPDSPGNKERRSAPEMVSFQVLSKLHKDDHSELLQRLIVAGSLTIEPDKDEYATICRIQFAALNFFVDFGDNCDELTPPALPYYHQTHLHVTVDSHAEYAPSDIIKPRMTLTNDKTSKVASTEKSGWSAGFNAGATAAPLKPQATLALAAGRVGERSTNTERTVYGSRINPQIFDGGAVCRFDIDDESDRKQGIRLSDDTLPEVHIRFLGPSVQPTPLPVPSAINVEIKSYWFAYCDNGKPYPWAGIVEAATSKTATPLLYSNICQAVVLNIPFPLQKCADFQGQLLLDI